MKNRSIKSRRHLRREDRISIQGMIAKGWKLRQMADYLGTSVSTISKEIHRNSIRKAGNGRECDERKSMPYGLCNLCPKRCQCSRTKVYYDCTMAENLSRERLVETRSGSRMTTKTVSAISASVSECIRHGMSPYAVLSANPGLGISESTLRRMIEAGLIEGVGRMTLRNARKRRRKSDRKRYRTNVRVNNPARLVGRMMSDLRARKAAEPGLGVVQIDSVIGCRTDRKALLTVMFVDAGLQIGMLYDRENEAENVRSLMSELIGSFKEDAQKIFQAILTDNGTEFASVNLLEEDFPGLEVYFADPYRSCDKAECERNHEFIRYVIPKGVSLDGLTDGKVRLMFSHINSYPRKKLKGKTPLQVFSELYGEENLRRLGLENIDSGSVMLRPELLA